jgi:alkanesulfonate monooxygenase SsuD/methylene tetrahydromethanopterin reductase-like flavin-dependent oxidoreductase (luciferase family)
MTQRVRFGLCTDQNLSWAKTLERWRLFERLGFDRAWDCDHYIQPSRPATCELDTGRGARPPWSYH